MLSWPARSTVVGVLSILYGLLLGLLWAWILLTDQSEGSRESGINWLMKMPFVAAPLILVVVGYGLFSTRFAGPDARALKTFAVVVLALKVVVGSYWVIGLLLITNPFRGLLYPLVLYALTIEVIPSAVWAVVLALTRTPEKSHDDKPTS